MFFDQHLKDVLTLDLATGAVPALIGPPGVGKSSFIEALAAELGTRAFTLAANLLAVKEDLTGARLVSVAGGADYTQVFYPHVDIATAADYAADHPDERPILFLDEITRCPGDVQSALLSLVLLRRIGTKKLPDNLRLIVAGNDSGNVAAFDDASVSRFSIYHVEADAAVLKSYLDACDAGLHPSIAKALRTQADHVFEAPEIEFDDSDYVGDQVHTVRQITTPRTIDAFNRWLQAASKAGALTAMATTVASGDVTVLGAAVQGHLGKTEFATAVYEDIIAQMNKAAGTAGAPTTPIIPQPDTWDDIMAAATNTAREKLLGSLSSAERGQVLAFAMTRNDVDSRLVTAILANGVEVDLRQMISALTNSQILPEHIATVESALAAHPSEQLAQFVNVAQTLT
ncbi:MAG: AAA family ATPase [Bifidobacteriaceae bacterium]|jgi:hypothetical protein|nr:AAA family ATPase [Bifidobacteriaceae bacterium]